MNRRPIDTNGRSLSTEQLAVAAELQAYAARVAPQPSFAFADKVMTATANSPRPAAARGARVIASRLGHAAGSRLRVAFAQVAGGPAIPLKVRIQAGAMLVALALLITAGAAVAAAGAESVVNWVAPQVPSFGGPPPWDQHPTVTVNPATPVHTTHPNASDNPGNGVRPSQSPGSQASGHPNASDNPGNGGKSSPIPKPNGAAQSSGKLGPG